MLNLILNVIIQYLLWLFREYLYLLGIKDACQ